MSKINKEAIAHNFVTTQDEITRHGIGGAFSKNTIEKAARNSLAGTKAELNSLRLLALTNNITDDDFIAKGRVLKEKIESLEKLIWSE